mmetsp:Transcript_17217/g.55874  ORF Transcript_17217/g.55874 Transcript_17217/m.55874 type:complete len:305 (+) Transcript_17217:230-1144(+)
MAATTRSRQFFSRRRSFCLRLRARLTRDQQPMAWTSASWRWVAMASRTPSMPPRRKASTPSEAMPREKTMPSAPPMGRARKTTQWRATAWSWASSRKWRRELTTAPVTFEPRACLRTRSQWSIETRRSRHRRWTPATSANSHMASATSWTVPRRARSTPVRTRRCSLRSSVDERPLVADDRIRHGEQLHRGSQTSRCSRTRATWRRQRAFDATVCRSPTGRHFKTRTTSSDDSSTSASGAFRTSNRRSCRRGGVSVPDDGKYTSSSLTFVALWLCAYSVVTADRGLLDEKKLRATGLHRRSSYA